MPTLYNASSPNGPLRLGEILTDLLEVRIDTSNLPTIDQIRESGNAPVIVKPHPYAVVLNAECDLEWDFNARKGGDQHSHKKLDHVLICDLEDQRTLEDSGRMTTRKEREYARGNRDERYHYIAASPVEGVEYSHPEFYIDFKRVFTLPTPYVNQAIEAGTAARRGVLMNPWAQHLSQRFTNFLGRVGLPE